MLSKNSLSYGKYYHVYNRGINGCDLFYEDANFEYFLSLLASKVLPVIDLYAWVLMKNHFHLAFRVKRKEELDQTNLKPLHQYFSNLFNAYSKAFNKKYNRYGSLFQRPFKRKLITNKKYLKELIIYIHNNPIGHGFCEHPIEYPWSSYNDYISDDEPLVNKNEVLKMFGTKDNFKLIHQTSLNRLKSDKFREINDNNELI